MKKKLLMSTIMVAGLLLLASCGTREGIGPIELPESKNTPTPIVVPTCTPTVTPTGAVAAPTKKPTATPTVMVEPTVTPEPTKMPEATATPTKVPTPVPTATPEPTKALEATATPMPTATPEPTKMPEATATPMPTATPEPTKVPEATATPTPVPTATPVPAFNPENLVNNGWQKTVSIDEEYAIIFPEVFRNSTVERTETELRTTYTCQEEEDTSFSVAYVVQTTLDKYAQEVLTEEKAVVKILSEEKRMTFEWQENGIIYQGVLVESQYAQKLLGSSFGEEEWIDGVMEIVFAYPEERKAEYETEKYKYYVVNTGEE